MDSQPIATLTSTKHGLLTLSHAMEATVLDGQFGMHDGRGLVLGLFQRRAYFVTEATRYAELAALGYTCIVAFVGECTDMPPGVHAVSLDPASPLAADWTLVLLDASMGVALVATDAGELSPGDGNLEASRVFHGRWSFRQDIAAGIAGGLIDDLAAGLPSEVASTARDIIAGASEVAPDPVRDRLAQVTEQLVAQIDSAHRRSDRLASELRSSRALAEVDQLTGLHNRHYLERFLDTTRDGAPLALAALLIDLDDLKSINDTYGHGAGDAAIRATAACIVANTRESDVLCRLGGDEFLVLIPGYDAQRGLAAGERIAAAIRAADVPEPWSGLSLGASVGVAMAEPTHIPLDLLDAALYEVKRTEKGGARLAS